MPGQKPRFRQTSVPTAKCKAKPPRSCKLHGICILADQPKDLIVQLATPGAARPERWDRPAWLRVLRVASLLRNQKADGLGLITTVAGLGFVMLRKAYGTHTAR